jgi:hypothetical protein
MTENPKLTQASGRAALFFSANTMPVRVKRAAAKPRAITLFVSGCIDVVGYPT